MEIKKSYQPAYPMSCFVIVGRDKNRITSSLLLEFIGFILLLMYSNRSSLLKIFAKNSGYLKKDILDNIFYNIGRIL